MEACLGGLIRALVKGLGGGQEVEMERSVLLARAALRKEGEDQTPFGWEGRKLGALVVAHWEELVSDIG